MSIFNKNQKKNNKKLIILDHTKINSSDYIASWVVQVGVY